MYYPMVIEVAEEVALHLKGFATNHPERAARLFARLGVFPDDPEAHGEFLRGSGARAMYVVPTRSEVGHGGAAGVIVCVDKAVRSVRIVRFLGPGASISWNHHERWAEQQLGI